MNDSTLNMMMYDAQKKSGVVAFLLWFFLGSIGAHRFYLGRTASGVVQLLLFILGWASVAIYIGGLMLFVLYAWALIDVFRIPRMVREHNFMLASRLS